MARKEEPFLVSSTALSVLAVVGLFLLSFLQCLPLRPAMENARTLPLEVSEPEPHPDAATTSNDTWREIDVVRGREECMHLLKSVAADVELLPPIKQSNCGLPAPVRLKSLGSSPQLTFDPPLIINCRMMATLYRWNKRTLQPVARAHLGSPVSRISGSSGYSCRNVYFSVTGNLSQHAFANAVDVGAFELADGRRISVLEGWGPTARDAQARTKVAPERLRSQPVAGEVHTTAPSPPPAVGKALTKASLLLRTPQQQKIESSVTRVSTPKAVRTFKQTIATRFLNGLHKGACQEFETVLGPEANEVHRNHFHFDLNSLRSQAYCE